MRRCPAAAMLLSIPILLLVFAACGGGSDDDDPTPASSPSATAEPTLSEPADAIRSIDLEDGSVVSSFIDEIGGEYVQTNVLYADVTGDGAEDAIAPLSSGGTLGDIGFIVVALDDAGDLVEVLSVDAREFGVSVSVEGGALIAVEPVPGPDDPECCPSQIRTTTYIGTGEGLREESSVITQNPAGGAKTPAPED